MSKYTDHVQAPQLPKDTYGFTRTHIGKTGTLSDLLRYTREHAGLTLQQCSKKTDIHERYLSAIERSRYDELPGEMYTRGWIKKYAVVLGLSANEVADIYEHERAIRSRLTLHEHDQVRKKKKIPMWKFLTPRRLLFIAVIVFIVSYIAFVLYQSIAPPSITFTSPFEDMSTQEQNIIISGRTESGTTVRINQQPIELDENGSFSQELHLEDGLQTVSIEAKKKNSRAFVKEIKIVKISPPELNTTTSTNAITN